MNLDRNILQILDNSACLSKGQLSGYLSRSLYPEELRAVELHLSECPFCSDALDGFEQEQGGRELLAAVGKVPVLPALPPKENKVEAVLDKVVKTVSPKAPAVRTAHSASSRSRSVVPDRSISATARERHSRTASGSRLKPLGIAAGMLAVIGMLWYVARDKEQDSRPLADNRQQSAQETVIPEDSARSVESGVPSVSDRISRQDSSMLKNTGRAAARDTVTPEKAVPVATANDTGLGPGSQAASGQQENRISAIKTETLSAPAVAIKAEQSALPDQAVDKAGESPAAKEEREQKKAARPDDKMTDYEMGVALYKQQQYGSALLYLRPAQRNSSDPKHYDAVYYSALCYKNTGQKKKAVQLFRKLVEEGAPQKSSAQKQLKELGIE